MRVVNFDGLAGPTHCYGGLSLGNLAATVQSSAWSLDADEPFRPERNQSEA